MKRAMISKGVSTTPYVTIGKFSIEEDVKQAIEKVDFPLFVKLNIAQSSMGISDKSICRCYEDAVA